MDGADSSIGDGNMGAGPGGYSGTDSWGGPTGTGFGDGSFGGASVYGDLGDMFSGLDGNMGMGPNGFDGLDFAEATMPSDFSEEQGLWGKLAKGYTTFMGSPLGKGLSLAATIANPALGPIQGMLGLVANGAQGKGAQGMGNALGSTVQGMFGPVGQAANVAGIGLGPAMGQAFGQSAAANGNQSFGESPFGVNGSGGFSGQTPYGTINLGGIRAPGGSWMDTVIGLGSLYGQYRNNKNMQGQASALSGMFSPNSAYAKQLEQKLSRRDAAAGRRSQYGPREVELQAALAGQAGNIAPALNTLYGQIGQGQNNLFSQGANLYRNGAFRPLQDGLEGLWGGGGG